MLTSEQLVSVIRRGDLTLLEKFNILIIRKANVKKQNNAFLDYILTYYNELSYEEKFTLDYMYVLATFLKQNSHDNTVEQGGISDIHTFFTSTDRFMDAVCTLRPHSSLPMLEYITVLRSEHLEGSIIHIIRIEFSSQRKLNDARKAKQIANVFLSRYTLMAHESILGDSSRDSYYYDRIGNSREAIHLNPQNE